MCQSPSSYADDLNRSLMSQQASNAVCPMKHAHLSEKTKIANNVGLSKEIKHFHNVSVLKELFTKCLINNHFWKEDHRPEELQVINCSYKDRTRKSMKLKWTTWHMDLWTLNKNCVNVIKKKLLKITHFCLNNYVHTVKTAHEFINTHLLYTVILFRNDTIWVIVEIE